MEVRKIYRILQPWIITIIKTLPLLALVFATLAAALFLPFFATMARQYRAFSPIQKYWFTTYWRAEFSTTEQSIYRLLLVEGANEKDRWLANGDDVIPGATSTSDGQVIPFRLTDKYQSQGLRLVLLPPMPQYNDYLWESLRDQVYSGKSIKDMGDHAIRVGWKLVLLSLCGWFAYFIARLMPLRSAAARQLGPLITKALRRGGLHAP